jgi:hypothetical protein
MSDPLFDVDVSGLRSTLLRRDAAAKAGALLELYQNAVDADGSTQIDISLTREPGSRWVELEVRDNSPDGFANLADAYTLFGKSTKVSDVSKRGMFNVGEKLTVSIMNGGASVTTTTGQVVFDVSANRRRRTRERTESGSVFRGRLTMTRQEQEDAEEKVRSLLPPEGVELRLNGELIPHRAPRQAVEAKGLACVVWDADKGGLKRTSRNTTISIVEPLPDEEPHLYVLGIPVLPSTRASSTTTTWATASRRTSSARRSRRASCAGSTRSAWRPSWTSWTRTRPRVPGSAPPWTTRRS